MHDVRVTVESGTSESSLSLLLFGTTFDGMLTAVTDACTFKGLESCVRCDEWHHATRTVVEPGTGDSFCLDCAERESSETKALIDRESDNEVDAASNLPKLRGELRRFNADIEELAQRECAAGRHGWMETACEEPGVFRCFCHRCGASEREAASLLKRKPHGPIGTVPDLNAPTPDLVLTALGEAAITHRVNLDPQALKQITAALASFVTRHKDDALRLVLALHQQEPEADVPKVEEPTTAHLALAAIAEGMPGHMAAAIARVELESDGSYETMKASMDRLIAEAKGGAA